MTFPMPCHQHDVRTCEIALVLRDAGLVIAITASCGAITALVIYGLQLRWALSLCVAGLDALTKNTAA